MSSKQLKERIDLLPKGPAWECRVVVVEGGTTKQPIKFYFRRGLECLKFLIGNPVLRGHSAYVAYDAFSDATCKTQVFCQGMGGEWANKMQVRLLKYLALSSLLIMRVEGNRKRRNNCDGYTWVRQDTPYQSYRRQGVSSIVFDQRQH